MTYGECVGASSYVLSPTLAGRFYSPSMKIVNKEELEDVGCVGYVENSDIYCRKFIPRGGLGLTSLGVSVVEKVFVSQSQ